MYPSLFSSWNRVLAGECAQPIVIISHLGFFFFSSAINLLKVSLWVGLLSLPSHKALVCFIWYDVMYVINIRMLNTHSHTQTYYLRMTHHLFLVLLLRKNKWRTTHNSKNNRLNSGWFSEGTYRQYHAHETKFSTLSWKYNNTPKSNYWLVLFHGRRVLHRIEK